MAEELVDLITARDANEARVIQSVLLAAGIPAIVEGGSLMDEWASSQRLMGQIGSVVRVPTSVVEEAHRALDAARDVGDELTESSDVGVPETAPAAPESTESDQRYQELIRAKSWPTSAVVTTVGLLALTVSFGALWGNAELEMRAAQQDPHLEYVWNATGTALSVIDKKSGRRVFVHYDADGDRVFERTDALAPDGSTTWENLDDDSNGFYERGLLHSPSTGRIICELIDEDGDNFPERVVIVTEGGTRRVFQDTNGDFEFEEPR